ncbi:SCO family protein [Azohydromonas aeria]|uniref:SCO family protein n=1 Tax=Azohydromonas aeria TaxID=2590212 RepID=UPI0018DF0515|nr:SCO family protein [Azohydromonas aeria]
MLLGVWTVPARAQSATAERYPNVALQTHDGRSVRFHDDLLKGKSVAIHVIYTSCTDECPLEMANLAQLQRLLGERMGRDVVFYSISIDPKTDTPAVLKDYAQRFSVGPGWTLLTGKPEDIALLTRKLGLVRRADSAGKDGHMPMLLLGQEATGQWMRHSAVDNPRFLHAHMKNFFGWRDAEAAPGYAQARPLALEPGQLLFQSRCSACHTATGEAGGSGLAPDLLGVTARRERAWLERYVAAPDRLQAQGDPTALRLAQQYPKVRMPNLRLSSTEVASVLDHLAAEAARRPAPEPGAPAAPRKVSAGHQHHH